MKSITMPSTTIAAPTENVHQVVDNQNIKIRSRIETIVMSIMGYFRFSPSPLRSAKVSPLTPSSTIDSFQPQTSSSPIDLETSPRLPHFTNIAPKGVRFADNVERRFQDANGFWQVVLVPYNPEMP